MAPMSQSSLIDKMNQLCRVCDERAAGYHFGAFTCEGCKSFFGRTYNNLSIIAECKNNGQCVINKKNRTSCKACRLKKCLMVGMSKSGSRYGRRSNWFKIHCLLQEHHQVPQQQPQQQQQQQQQQQHLYPHTITSQSQRNPTTSPPLGIHANRQKEDNVLNIDDTKNSISPSTSSPDSFNSESSIEISERRAAFVGHPTFRSLQSHQQHIVPDLSTLNSEIMNLPLGFHLGGMPFISSNFFPPPNLSMISPYHIYNASHSASIHRLIPNHSSTGHLRSSPVTDESSSQLGNVMTTGRATVATASASTTATTTTAPTTTTGTAYELAFPVPIASSTPNIVAKDTCSNNDNDDTQDENNYQTRGNSLSTTDSVEKHQKRYYLDAVLKSQKSTGKESPILAQSGSNQDTSSPCNLVMFNCLPLQDDPIDLSVKSNKRSNVEVNDDVDDDIDDNDEEDKEVDCTKGSRRERPQAKKKFFTPIDLTKR